MSEIDNITNEVINSSIRINAKIWEDFKIYCIKHKISMSEKLEEIIMGVIQNDDI